MNIKTADKIKEVVLNKNELSVASIGEVLPSHLVHPFSEITQYLFNKAHFLNLTIQFAEDYDLECARIIHQKDLLFAVVRVDGETYNLYSTRADGAVEVLRNINLLHISDRANIHFDAKTHISKLERTLENKLFNDVILDSYKIEDYYRLCLAAGLRGNFLNEFIHSLIDYHQPVIHTCSVEDSLEDLTIVSVINDNTYYTFTAAIKVLLEGGLDSIMRYYKSFILGEGDSCE